MHWRLTSIAILAVGILIRIGAAASSPIWFDEATVGLMARNVLTGEFPWFFYGQSFMGAVEAYLHALAFTLWGSSVTALRVWPILISFGHVALAALLCRRIFGNGVWAMWLSLLPSPFLLKWGHDARLHYDLILVLTPLLLLLALQGLDDGASPVRRCRALLIFAFASGLGWWINLLMGLLPVSLALALLVRRPRLHAAAWGLPLAFLLGSGPFWIFSLKHGGLASGTAQVAAPGALADHGWQLVTNAVPILMGIPRSVPPGGLRGVMVVVALSLTEIDPGLLMKTDPPGAG